MWGGEAGCLTNHRKGGVVVDHTFNSKGLTALGSRPVFQLTEAVRPGPCSPVHPIEGFRRELWKGPKGERVPLLAISVSKEKILDLFLALLEPLGNTVDVILESTHGPDGTPTPSGRQGRDLTRKMIDLPIFSSHCLEYEDLLLNDGCTGISVISSRARRKGLIREVQLDEHKTIIIYSEKLISFQKILESFQIGRQDDMRLLLEGDHLHRSSVRHMDQFGEFASVLGAEAKSC